jgi:hypothetical protein
MKQIELYWTNLTKNVCSVVEVSWIKQYFIDKSKVPTIKENEILQLFFMTNFKLQATYAIKISLATNDMIFEWKIKFNKSHFHPLTKCIHIVICN